MLGKKIKYYFFSIKKGLNHICNLCHLSAFRCWTSHQSLLIPSLQSNYPSIIKILHDYKKSAITLKKIRSKIVGWPGACGGGWSSGPAAQSAPPSSGTGRPDVPNLKPLDSISADVSMDHYALTLSYHTVYVIRHDVGLILSFSLPIYLYCYFYLSLFLSFSHLLHLKRSLLRVRLNMYGLELGSSLVQCLLQHLKLISLAFPSFSSPSLLSNYMIDIILPWRMVLILDGYS